jgi:hypothetical protein
VKIRRVSPAVDAATIDFSNRDLLLKFEVTSETGQRVGDLWAKPDQMREGRAIVGKYDGQAFTAQSPSQMPQSL